MVATPKRILILVASVGLVATVFGIWLSPSAGAIAALASATLGLLSILQKPADSGREDRKAFLTIDLGDLGEGKRSVRLPYDPAFKVWELFEVINEAAPSALPEGYGGAWLLRDLSTGRQMRDLATFYRDRHRLEEEARGLPDAGIHPDTTLSLIRLEGK